MKNKIIYCIVLLLCLFQFSCSVQQKIIPYSHVVKTFDMEGYAVDLAVNGNYAYIANKDTGLQIINISNPLSASIMREVTNNTAMGLDVSGNRIYLVGSSGRNLIDIQQPENAMFLTNLDNGNYALSKIKVCGDYYFSICSDKSLYVFEKATGAMKAVIPVTYIPRDLFIEGNYAYVISSDKPWNDEMCKSALDIISISNINNIHKITNLPIEGSAKQVFVNGKYAYIANNGKGLCIVELTDPGSAKVVNRVDVSGSYVETVFVQDQKAYVGGNWGIRVVDVSNPLEAHETDVAYTDFYIYRLAVVGHYVYAIGATSDGGNNYISCFAIAEMLN